MTPLLDPKKVPAAGLLADIVTELKDKKVTNTVGSVYCELDKDLRQLACIGSESLLQRCINFVHKEAVDKLTFANYMPKIVVDLLKNVMKSRVRMARRGDNTNRLERLKEKYGWNSEFGESVQE